MYTKYIIALNLRCALNFIASKAARLATLWLPNSVLLLARNLDYRKIACACVLRCALNFIASKATDLRHSIKENI